MKINFDDGRIIGKFDLYDYGLPPTMCYLFYQAANGGNTGNEYQGDRQYLRIIGLTPSNEFVEYGYIYFNLYTTSEGLKVSSYIGSKVDYPLRGMGLGDLLMSIYLYYSYDNGYFLVESNTRQRKLDILSMMNKYGFRVTNPEVYKNGERTTMYGNRMVVDVFKSSEKGTFYRFKTRRALDKYIRSNNKLGDTYRYLPPLDERPTSALRDFERLGWFVTHEDYILPSDKKVVGDELVDHNLKKSHFSR